MTAAPDAHFSMGTAASQTFESVGKNFAYFLVLALIIVVPEQAGAWYMRSAQFTLLRQVNPANLISFAEIYLAFLIGSLVISSLLHAAIAQATVVTLSGQRASIGGSIGAALRAFVPIIIIWIFVTLGALLGLILLVVPGIILLLGWSLIVPVRVVERTGIFATMGRSWSLTSGHRWAILGLVLVFYVGAFAVQLVGATFAGVAIFAQPTSSAMPPLAYMVFSSIVGALTGMINAAGSAAIYYQLRVVKEGIGPEQFAAVFE